MSKQQLVDNDATTDLCRTCNTTIGDCDPAGHQLVTSLHHTTGPLSWSVRSASSNRVTTRKSTAPVVKTAIAVPADLLRAVDVIAHERGESRSRFVQHLLHAAVRSRTDAEVTRRLDALFADPALAERQRRETEEMDSAGTDWSDERW
jgi:hypothetical protein